MYSCNRLLLIDGKNIERTCSTVKNKYFNDIKESHELVTFEHNTFNNLIF